jgi:hypothetical protein
MVICLTISTMIIVSSGGSTGIETIADILTSYSIRWMRRM